MSDKTELIRYEESSRSLIRQANDIITKVTINRAKDLISRYNSKSDVIHFETALSTIKKMLNDIITDDCDDPDVLYLYMQEFKIRIVEIDRILEKSRKKRPRPKLSEEDMEIMADIIDAWVSVYGRESEYEIANGIVPFLLETKREVEYL